MITKQQQEQQERIARLVAQLVAAFAELDAAVERLATTVKAVAR